jgi:hypothetical protein
MFRPAEITFKSESLQLFMHKKGAYLNIRLKHVLNHIIFAWYDYKFWQVHIERKKYTYNQFENKMEN